MRIVLINHSKSISDKDVERIAEACDLQLKRDVAPAWNVERPLRVTVGSAPDVSSYPFFFVDSIPEAPGALAYHYVQSNGVPAGKIGVHTTQQAGESVASATSHETVELQCDIFCATWSYSDRLRCLVATEACDPVQSETYGIEVSDRARIEVSNFVTPDYFTEDPPGNRLDHLHTLKRPFDIAPGGYQIQMKAGRVKSVYGVGVSAALRAGKDASQGRTYWRHITMAIALMSK